MFGYFSQAVVAFANYIFQASLFVLGLLNEAFDGVLVEVLIGAGSWLLFFVLSRRKVHAKPKVCDEKVEGKIHSTGEPVQPQQLGHIRSQRQSRRTSANRPAGADETDGETQEVQLLVAHLLSREARQNPVASMERYDQLVRVRGLDLRSHLGGEQRARAFYLALAACGLHASSPVAKSGKTSLRSHAAWMQRLFADMRRFSFHRTLEFYTSLAKTYALEHRSKEILGLSDEMDTDAITADRGLLICFMNAAVACDEGRKALYFSEELEKLGPPTMRTYMTVLNIYKSKHDCEGAVSLLGRMQAQGIQPDTLFLNQVLALCVSATQVHEAAKLLRRFPEERDVISCNTLLKGYAQMVDLPSAETLLESMLTRGPQPNVVTFNTIMDCAVRSLRSLESASFGYGSKGSCHGEDKDRRTAMREIANKPWEYLEQLTRLGLKPDRYSCSIIVKGMHQSGAAGSDIDRAIALIRQAGPSVLQPSDEGNSNDLRNNLRLVEVLFNTLLDICASTRDIDRIVNIFSIMQEFKVTITNVTFGILIKAFGQAGLLNRCHEVWQGMLNANVEPTVVTYGCYIDACIRNKDLSCAERIFASMASTSVRPNAVIYTSMIRGLASVKEPAKAFKLYRKMRQDGVSPTSVTFNSVLDMVARQLSDPEILQSVLNDMRTADSAPDAVSCSILIKASCGAGNVDNAMALFRQTRGKDLQCDQISLNLLLLSCAQTDRAEDAKEVLEYMRQLRLPPSSGAVDSLVKMYGRARFPAKAEALVDSTQREFGQKPNLQVYTSLVQVLAQGKMWQRALDFSDRMARSGVEPTAAILATMIQGCIQLGRFGQVMDLVRRTAPRVQLDIPQGVLEQLRQAGQLALASELEDLISRRRGRSS